MQKGTSVCYCIRQGYLHVYNFTIQWYTKYTTEQKRSSLAHHKHVSLQEHIIGSLPYSTLSEKFFFLWPILGSSNNSDYTNIDLGFLYNSFFFFFTFEVFFLSANPEDKTVLKYDLSSLILLICILQMMYSCHHITWNKSSKSSIKKKKRKKKQCI